MSWLNSGVMSSALSTSQVAVLTSLSNISIGLIKAIGPNVYAAATSADIAALIPSISTSVASTTIANLTSAYTVAASDITNQRLQFNCNGSFNVTIPLDAVLGIPANNTVSIVISLLQLGTNINSFVGSSGMFLNVPSVTPGQYIITSIQWVSPNTWVYI